VAAPAGAFSLGTVRLPTLEEVGDQVKPALQVVGQDYRACHIMLACHAKVQAFFLACVVFSSDSLHVSPCYLSYATDND